MDKRKAKVHAYPLVRNLCSAGRAAILDSRCYLDSLK